MRLIQLFLIGISLVIVSGCTMQAGDIGARTHFSFPNSNIARLGKVSETLVLKSWLVPPRFSSDDVAELLQKAKKKSGADLIIDYKVDTKITSYVWYHELTLTIEGTAAKFDDIGMQSLDKQEMLKKLDY